MLEETNNQNSYREMNKENYSDFNRDTRSLFGENRGYKNTNGNSNSLFKQNGSSNYTRDERPLKNCSSFKDDQEEYNTKVAFKITRFNNLPSFKTGINPQDVIKRVKEDFRSKNWKCHFDAINTLRVLNKFYSEEANHIFENFGEEVCLALNDVKTAIQKNMLFFVYEVFNLGRPEKLNEKIIEVLLPKLIRFCFSEKKFLKKMSQEIIDLILKKYISNTTIQCLCYGAVVENNKPLLKLSMELLIAILSKLKKNISKCSNETLKFIFKVFAKNLNAPTKKSYDLALSGAMFLLDLMGHQNYHSFVNLMKDDQKLTKKEYELLLNEVGKTQNYKKPRLSTMNKMEILSFKSSTKNKILQKGGRSGKIEIKVKNSTLSRIEEMRRNGDYAKHVEDKGKFNGIFSGDTGNRIFGEGKGLFDGDCSRGSSRRGFF